MTVEKISADIRVILGLGNPGLRFYKTRHNIGFRILDLLAEHNNGTWKKQGDMEISRISINEKNILLVKPQTFMNNSGEIVPALKQMGLKSENALVVHDDIEVSFGKVKIRLNGSHRGHNGLRSIIDNWGKDFYRLRFGIGRPEDRLQVPDYVLQTFSESSEDVENSIDLAVQAISAIFNP